MMKSKKQSSIIPWSLIVLIVLLFLVLLFKSGSSSVIKISDQSPVVGRDDAPVTVVMFGVYTCPYSAKFFDEIYPWLEERYINTGRVKFVYKNFYPPSDKDILAAEAALCAHDQDMFLPYNNLLFKRAKEWSQSISNPGIDEIFNPVFVQYASELGLDEKTFLECLSKHFHREDVIKDYDYGIELGVSKKPTFFINSLVIEGLPSGKDFESVLLKFGY